LQRYIDLKIKTEAKAVDILEKFSTAVSIIQNSHISLIIEFYPEAQTERFNIVIKLIATA
jgi:hypothetical protein